MHIVCIIGPTASGKSTRGIDEALARSGEIISVDSRQVYRGLDIGTEKTLVENRQGIPHHLIDIRDLRESYSAGDFVTDASALIEEIAARDKLPILVGGTHFYFHALLAGLPMGVAIDPALRTELEKMSDEELFAQVREADPRRAQELDPQNRRRLIRALEIIKSHGTVPERSQANSQYEIDWIVLDPPREELRSLIDARLASALESGLVGEVEQVRAAVGDVCLNELGLEYKIVGEYLREERTEETLLPTLSAKLWQYARRQKAWLRKMAHELGANGSTEVAPLLQDKS